MQLQDKSEILAFRWTTEQKTAIILTSSINRSLCRGRGPCRTPRSTSQSRSRTQSSLLSTPRPKTVVSSIMPVWWQFCISMYPKLDDQAISQTHSWLAGYLYCECTHWLDSRRVTVYLFHGIGSMTHRFVGRQIWCRSRDGARVRNWDWISPKRKKLFKTDGRLETQRTRLERGHTECLHAWYDTMFYPCFAFRNFVLIRFDSLWYAFG